MAIKSDGLVESEILGVKVDEEGVQVLLRQLMEKRNEESDKMES